METVVGLYKNFATARMVIQELLDYGIERENINVTRNHGTNGNQQESPEASAPVSTAEASADINLDALSALTVAGMRPFLGAAPVGAPVAGIAPVHSVDQEIPEDDVEPYNRNTSEGGTLVTVEAPNEMVSHVTDMMGRYRDLELKHGNEVPDEAALSQESNELPEEGSEMRLPVIEEQLHVSKRVVEQGGVRVHTRLTEEPVQQEVTVQEEELHVERHPANRPLAAQELSPFTEGTIEITTMAEELLIGKVARVVEEVIIQKNVTEHIETIEESVRRRDVQVEAFNRDQFANHNQEIEAHYEQSYAESRYTYPQILPAYRYGYRLANSAAYQNAPWNEIEAEVEQAWEQKNPNTWETFKDAIQYGWSRVRA